VTRNFRHIRRLVVKIGTSTLTKRDGSLRRSYIRNIATQVAALIKQGLEVMVVSSGAIGSGVKELGLEGMPRDIPTRQGAAAVGQSMLMETWRAAFKRYGLKAAQILLTYENFSNRRTYVNLRNSISTLMKHNTVLIINENDPISVHEIEATFGDNDKLSALVASKVDADLLVVLTDVGGLYDRNPRLKGAQLISEVKEITPEIERMGGKAGSWRTRGGMRTKIEAAKITMKANCGLVIAKAEEKSILTRILKGEDIGTLFKAANLNSRNKERWLRFAKCSGRVIVDKGTEEALLRGRHLLPSGIVDVEGKFDAGSIVSVVHGDREVAHGIVDYSSAELMKIKGKHSNEIEAVLGYKKHSNVIRKGNMVMI